MYYCTYWHGDSCELYYSITLCSSENNCLCLVTISYIPHNSQNNVARTDVFTCV